MRTVFLSPILLPFALTTVFVAGCASSPESAKPALAETAAVPAAPAVDWQGTVNAFVNGYFQRNPTDAANAGKHEFDGKLPDWSEAGLQEHSQWLRSQRQLIAGIDDSALDERQRFQREYVLAVIDKSLFWRDDAR